MKYVAGWNMPGCLCDNEPAEFKTFYEAQSYIVEEMLRYLHELYDIECLTDRQAEDAEAEVLELKKLEYPFTHKMGQYIFWVQRN